MAQTSEDNHGSTWPRGWLEDIQDTFNSREETRISDYPQHHYRTQDLQIPVQLGHFSSAPFADVVFPPPTLKFYCERKLRQNKITLKNIVRNPLFTPQV